MDSNEIMEVLAFAATFFRAREKMAAPGPGKTKLIECEAACQQAIKMLDAQTPRLLTAEDFHGNPDLDDGGALPCWKEACKATRRSGWAVICYGKWLADTAKPAGAYCAARYWTARPSDEQREATPWP